MNEAISSQYELFKNAIDFFFGFNPKNPYWILVAMHLRKCNNLAIEKNYDGELSNIISPIADKNYIDTFKTSVELNDCETLCVVGHNIDSNPILAEAIENFRIASENIVNPSGSIFQMKQWDTVFLIDTAQQLINLDDNWFINNYSTLFYGVVRRIFAKTRIEDFLQPSEFSELMGKLIPRDAKKIYNPFAGFGSIGIKAPEGISYLGEEINPLVASIANLRMLSSNIDGYVQIADSVESLYYGFVECDTIVSTPPFHTQINNPYHFKDMEKLSTCETFLLHKCVEKKKYSIISIPNILLVGEKFFQIRKFLVDRNSIDTVIMLPLSAVLIINPNRNSSDKIKLVDARNCTSAETKRYNDVSLNVDSVMLLLNDDSASVKVAMQDLIKNEYILSPDEYVTSKIEAPANSKVMTLSELGTFESKQISCNNQVGKFASLSELNNPNKLKIYGPEDFSLNILPKRAIEIDRDCILISGIQSVKAVCIETKGEKLYTNALKSVVAFYPNTDIILPQFLITQLDLHYVTEQVNGPLILTQRKIGSIRLIVPPREKQESVVLQYQARLIRTLGVKYDEIRAIKANEFEKNMHLRKHALKQVLNEAVPAARRIANFMSSHDEDFNKNTIIAERSGSTLEEYTSKLYANVTKIMNLVAALTDENQAKNLSSLPSINLSEFFSTYCKNKIHDRYDLCYIGESRLDGTESKLIESELHSPILKIKCEKKDLITLFDNIIANAVKHGFTDDNRNDYSVFIRFSNIIIDSNRFVEIRVLNNGNPLPQGMSPDRVFIWGVGSGTGLGSWQAKNLVELYGGKIELLQHNDNEADGFTIEYRIVFPLAE